MRGISSNIPIFPLPTDRFPVVPTADSGGSGGGDPGDGSTNRGDRRPLRGARWSRLRVEDPVDAGGAGASDGLEQGLAGVITGVHPRAGG